MPPARTATITLNNVLPDQHTRWLNGVFDGHRTLLAEAPVGEHALVEAALAWQLLPQYRAAPRGQAGPGPAWPGYVPLVTTPDMAVAGRVGRLLSGLAFAMVGENRAEPPAPAVAYSVQVAAVRHRPVLRGLNTVWRHTYHQFGGNPPVLAGDVRTAAALWRMAVLIGGVHCGPYRIGIRTTATIANVLVGAATGLNVRTRLIRSPRVARVLIEEPDQLHRLLRLVGVTAPILPSQQLGLVRAE
jgi:hypothetical protein